MDVLLKLLAILTKASGSLDGRMAEKVQPNVPIAKMTA